MDPRAAHKDSNPKVYLDIQIGEIDAGRLTIEASILYNLCHSRFSIYVHIIGLNNLLNERVD